MTHYRHEENKYIGRKYNRLLCLKKETKTDGRGNPYYLFKCDCGNETVSNLYHVTSGATTSCGCYHKERISRPPGQAALTAAYAQYRSNSRKRNLPFQITIEEFKEITAKSCYYCGSPPKNVNKQKGVTGNFVYSGIDREDNTKGYIKDNIIPCCKICNRAKGALSKEDFLSWISKVTKVYCESRYAN